MIRVGFREWVARLTALGIPPSRIGLMLGFQSGDPFGGRAGLQPTAAWLQIVKLQSQAGLVVARELALSTRVVVGVGDVRGAGQRRSPTSRPRPARTCGRAIPRSATRRRCGVPGFDPDLTAGAVDLAPGAAVPLRRRLVQRPPS